MFSASSQGWQKKLSEEKARKETLSFFDIQKAFNDYCQEHNIINGYYTDNGEEKIYSGYKHFKRWEYFWKPLVDPVTGEFPSITGEDMINASRTWRSDSEASPGIWGNIGISDNQEVGRVNCIVFHPDDYNIIYAGTPSGGLWKTSDHGDTWTCLTDDLPSLGVSAIVLIPDAEGDILYIGTGDRDADHSFAVGVLKSTDGGITWDTTGLSFATSDAQAITGLVKHPLSNQILFATTCEFSESDPDQDGFYITQDGGDTWSRMNTPSLNSRFIDLELDPDDSDHIYLSTRNNGLDTVYIYHSLDMGDTWDIIYREEGSRIEMTVSTDPDKPKWLYAVVAEDDPTDNNINNYGLKGIYKFLDGGTSYLEILDGGDLNLLGQKRNGRNWNFGQGHYDLTIAVDPNDGNRLFVGGIITFMSEDGYSWEWDNYKNVNLIWKVFKSYMTHADKHQLIFRPGTSELYECTDGGIYRRLGKRNWEGISEGMVISQMYRLGLNPHAEDKLLTGLQDNGTHKFNGSGWNQIHHSDGMEAIIDYDHPRIQYASSQEGNIVRTNINWAGVDPVNITQRDGDPIHGLNETGGWVTPYVIDPEDHSTLFLGLDNVWASVDKGAHWGKISEFPTGGGKISALAVAPNGLTDRWLYASYGNVLNYKWDFEDEWSTTAAPHSISYIAIKDSDPGKVWITMDGFNQDNVYTFQVWGETWTDLSAGLPELPVYCIVQNKANEFDEELYVGTEAGVYRKIGPLEWELYSSGLPNVRVTELEIYYSGLAGLADKQTLYASTFGRGMWKTELENINYRLWTGEVSTDWFDELNWDPNLLPTTSTNVYIPEDCSNWPIINSLELGVDCNNLRMYDNSEMTVISSLKISAEKKLICNSGSILYIGGEWYNENDAALIEEGYGFLPEPGSEVNFTFQAAAPLLAEAGSETFRNLTISKIDGSFPFQPHSHIIVMEQCSISSGTWVDHSALVHQVHQDFFVSTNGVFHMQDGGKLEFVGNIPQAFAIESSDSYNSIQTIYVDGDTVNQLNDLSGAVKINKHLTIERGTYSVGKLITEVLGEVTVESEGSLLLDTSTLMINYLHVKHEGSFQSGGITEDSTHITQASSLNFSFQIDGTIESQYTSFYGMNIHGVHITGQGEIGEFFNDCSFTSLVPNATLLKINNNQEFILDDLQFNFNPTQKSVTKTVNIGQITLIDYSPSNSDDYEEDPFDRIDWDLKRSVLSMDQDDLVKAALDHIHVFPNPSSGSFIIQNDHNASLTITIEISDMKGQVIYTSDLPPGKSTISTYSYKKGAYLLKISSNGRFITKKLVFN
jgi:hypothetical protein